jgi:uncharacterized OB-fold protein
MAETAAPPLAFEFPDPFPDFPLPKITPDTDFFWRSGEAGVLRLLRCTSCAYVVHPPSPRCPRCGSGQVAPSPMSGHGAVYSFTIAVQAFLPGLAPYCVAMVEIAEQPDVRLVGMLVGCTAETVRVGLPVGVEFVQRSADVWVPCFRAVAA